MKYKVLAMLALSLFIVTSAVAGKGEGGPNIAGMWEGTGQAMYMDGTTAVFTVDFASIYQEGKFVYGDIQITTIVGENDPVTQPGQVSGHIQGNVLKGTFGGCLTVAPDCFGVSTLEGKITGKNKKISGTVIDLSDGSTGVVTMTRMTE